jgi:enediyne biosynthesis protein E4
MSIGLRGITGAAVLVSCAALSGFPDAADPASISFEEVSTILFEHAAGLSDSKHLPETMGSGVALVDVDQDGRLDIFFVNGANTKHRLLRNLGNLRFQDVTTQWGIGADGWGMGVAVGDYNNDGFPDLYITSVGRNRLYRNTGSRFVDATATAGVAASGWSAGAAFLDYDRDGRLDLFVARYLDWDIGKSKWCGEGEGAPRSYCHPREFRKVSHALFRNRGNGAFEDVSRRMGIEQKPGKGLGVKIEDVNGDQWPDILVANDSVPQQLFINVAGKTFDEAALRSGIAYGPVRTILLPRKRVASIRKHATILEELLEPVGILAVHENNIDVFASKRQQKRIESIELVRRVLNRWGKEMGKVTIAAFSGDVFGSCK